MTVASQPLFLFGPGYCAKALARIWDGPVIAVSRSEAAKSALSDAGMMPVLCTNTARLAQTIRQAHVLVSAPPGKIGCPALASLATYADEAASVTYLSTTGVYGDLAGGWVFEGAKLHPQSVRSKRRMAAEQSWSEVRPDIRIVRLPGIYGPGRSALDRIRAGQVHSVVKPGQVFSRAHVDDIASGLKALIMSDARGVFHLCDDEPAPPQEIAAFAAHLLAVDPPQQVAIEATDLSVMARSFYAECKRVSNAKIKAVTGWRPQYKTYREGLRAIQAAGG